MRKFLIACFLFSVTALRAQTEVVLSLKHNAKLFHQSGKKIQELYQKKLPVEQGNILIVSDTLSLPFIDDFSKNTLRKNDFYTRNLTDSFFLTYGPCDSVLGVEQIQGRFILQQTWDYTFNVTTQQVDSTPTSPITFIHLPNTGSECLTQPGGTLVLYPEFYHYTFDSATGEILSEILDTIYPDTILTYVPVIYRATMDNDAKWMNNSAYWNTTYPVLPPTIGVATLDGLNQYGLPYNNSSPINTGKADALTSKPLDLSAFSAGDSVYLSFFYQSQGIGDWPNRKDSLTLEFFNGYTSQWDVMWSVPGDSLAPNSVPDFKQVLIPVPETVLPNRNYFYKGFQFQFRNYASLAGNNDHWHIDYVRLSANRTFTDTVISDVAFVYDVPSVLKNYEIMPGRQYSGAQDLADSLKLIVRNDNYDQATNNPPATQYNIESNLLYPNSSIVFTDQNVFNANTVNEIVIAPGTDFSFPASTSDSISLLTKAYLSVSNINQQNDTIVRVQKFDNILAYDDGSAERAYGLEGLYLKKFAYEFELNVPDTLIGFQIHYTNIDVNVEDLIHAFSVWKNVTVGAYTDTPVYTSFNVAPLYIDTVNGFATYGVDSPLLLNGKFYLGWAQTDTRNLQVGYDLNSSKGYDHMYYYANGIWKKSTTPVVGSVMIRCIFNHYYGGFGAVNETEIRNIAIYPNPASNKVFVQSEENLKISLFDLKGRLVQIDEVSGNSFIDISALTNGLYILHFSDSKGSLYKTQKLIVVK